MNFGTSQFLHSPPLSQAGRLDGLEDGSGSAAPQSRVDGRQCPLVEQQQKKKIDHIYLAARVLCVWSTIQFFICRQRRSVDNTKHALAEKNKTKLEPKQFFRKTTTSKHVLACKAQYFNRCLLVWPWQWVHPAWWELCLTAGPCPQSRGDGGPRGHRRQKKKSSLISVETCFVPQEIIYTRRLQNMLSIFTVCSPQFAFS